MTTYIKMLAAFSRTLALMSSSCPSRFYAIYIAMSLPCSLLASTVNSKVFLMLTLG